MENLGATIDNAVDAAVTAAATPGQESAAPSAPVKPAESQSTASLPVDPAAASGPDAASATTAKPEGSTQQTADDDEGTLRDDAKWLTPEKRRTTLSNAREKGASAERTRIYSEFGILPTDNPASVAQHVRAFLDDPVAYHARLGETLRRKGFLKDEPAPRTETRQPASDGQGFKLPDPTFRTADGRGVYSTEDMEQIVNGLFQHFDSQIETRLKPHEETLEEARASKAAAEVDRLALSDIATAQKWDRWSDVSKRVGEIMRDAVKNRDTTVTIRHAYNQAKAELYESERPQLETQIRTRLTEEIQQHPAGDIARPGVPVVQERSGRRRSTLSADIDAAVDRAARAIG
jgi:hypothetical protein